MDRLKGNQCTVSNHQSSISMDEPPYFMESDNK
jgi:hypothetical protein